MFEFILFFQVCSVLDGICMDSIKYPETIKTHHECVIKGYEQGLKIQKKFNKKDSNEKQIYITFSCIEVEKADT